MIGCRAGSRGGPAAREGPPLRACAGVDVTMPFRPLKQLPHEKRVEVAVWLLWCSLVYSLLSALVIAILWEDPWVAMLFAIHGTGAAVTARRLRKAAEPSKAQWVCVLLFTILPLFFAVGAVFF